MASILDFIYSFAAEVRVVEGSGWVDKGVRFYKVGRRRKRVESTRYAAYILIFMTLSYALVDAFKCIASLPYKPSL